MRLGDSMAVYLIGSTLCGIVFVVIGVWQMKTGSVSLLHDYHTVCVLPADKPKLAWRTGIDEVVIGILVAVGVPFVAWTQISFSEQDSLAYYVAGLPFFFLFQLLMRYEQSKNIMAQFLGPNRRRFDELLTLIVNF